MTPADHYIEAERLEAAAAAVYSLTYVAVPNYLLARAVVHATLARVDPAVLWPALVVSEPLWCGSCGWEGVVHSGNGAYKCPACREPFHCEGCGMPWTDHHACETPTEVKETTDG